MKHRDIQRAIIRHLQARYGPAFWYQNNLGGIGTRRGALDLVCLIHGTFVGIEVKTPNYPTVTAEQKAEINAIKIAGGRAGVIRTLEDLEQLIRDIKPQEGS
jgi:hypothetical protein